MKARTARVNLFFNGRAVSDDFRNSLSSFTFTDPASGESDVITYEFADDGSRWTASWFPVLGDAMTAAIELDNWKAAGDTQRIDCGTFTLDRFSLHGQPQNMSIEGVSQPLMLGFRVTPKSKTWENTTIKKIAQAICAAASLKLLYDAEDIPIRAIEQNTETDASFLTKLCDKYGMQVKIYRDRLIVYGIERYQKKPAVAQIPQEDCEGGWSYDSELEGSYTGGVLRYTDGQSNKEIVYTYLPQSKRVLEVSEAAADVADAERIIKGRIAVSNLQTTILGVSIMGGLYQVYAGQNVEMVGFGRISGTYYITKVTHSLDGAGYWVRLELSLVKRGSDAAVRDAIQRLANIGVMNSPGYWLKTYPTVPYLGELLLDMSAVLKITRDMDESIPADPIAVLHSAGITNNPNYWRGLVDSVPYLAELLGNAAATYINQECVR